MSDYGRRAAIRRRTGTAVLMAAGLSLLGITGASGAAKDDAAANCETLENDRFVLSVNPVGGRLMRFYSKAIGEELTDVGTFSEEDWAIRASHEFLIKKPYALRCRKENGELDILATANATGGGIDFLKIEKRFRSSPDSTSLRIDYRLTNTPEAMSERIYSILFHAILGIAGRDVNCFYPVADGIEKVPQKGSGKEHWGYYPARGWIAAATEDGKGLAVTMPFRDLRTFYSWFSPASLPTLEWRMTPVALGCGESYDVATEVIPFAGLRNVSGAGGGLVGELADGSCRVVSARAGTVTARAGGKAVELVFANPGDLREFATDAAFVELERDGKAVCRLDAMPKDGKTPLAPLEKQRVSPVKPIDLLCYTNFNATAESAWAKPLAGGAVRAAFVTGQGNQIEVGLLAARLDLDYRVIGGQGARNFRGFTNPQYSYGDHFSVAGTSDLQGEICRALEWESDVIVLGGAPFDGLPEKARKTIESRVRAGAGLVLIGQDRSIPAFGLELQPKAKTKPLVPQAVGDAFAGVPFDLLGREPVHPVATNGAVYASCGDRAYVSETRCGKGRVVNLAYFAAPDHVAPIYGITPGLLDFYPDRVAPAEFYFSLVAKAILKAAGRDLPLRFAGATVGATGAKIAADVAAAGTYSCSWCVKNAFRETLAEGSADVALAKGAGEIALPAELAAYGGPLSYELVVRKDGVVQNWGAWSFRLPPKAEIAALDFDANFHAEGEPIALTVRTTGAADGLALRLSLVDACGRTVDAKTVAASGTVTETLVARNALPMRSYTAVAELVDAGRVVAKRRLALVVRPDRAKIAWDDFEAGTWGNAETRQYLWPFVADTYRQYGIRTVCGNAYSLRYGFATRYDFNSMISHYAGLQRSMEPAEYTKTGDKTKLVRTPCISSPAYFEGTAKHIDSYRKVLDDYTFRIHGFGDEQSLTGFGGAAVDYCFSTNCLREFRAFVRARYGTLERLNAEWETDFADWDAVMPFTRQEVWDAKLKHVAGWADHREFMDDRVTNSLAFSVNRLRAAAPHLRFSISGTQSAAAYGGMDWWKIMHVLDSTMDYMTEGQTDMRRAYRPDGRFMPWAWGYGSRGPGAVNAVWRVPFLGGHGLIGFWARSQFRPDFQPSLGLADAQPHVLRLVHGVGRHLMDNLVFPREVALLHSQASFRCAFIEDRRKEQDAVLARYRTMLRNLGCAWDYVSYDQLAEGVVAARGYKALLLVDAVAMGDAEIAGVRDFAAKGGTVIADGMPATHTWNCRKRDASPLAGIFSGRNVLFPRESDAAVERPRLAAALERAGVPTARFAVTEPDGTPIPDAEIFYRTDRAGNPFFGVLSSDLKTRTVRYRFPREGWVFDLVDGKGYGRVSSVEAGWGRGVVHAFVVLDEPTGVGIASVEGAKVSFDCGSAIDTVLRVTVRRPDGSAADCYAKNVLAQGGKASYELPFALSDPAGGWRVTATNVLSGEAASCTVERAALPSAASARYRLYNVVPLYVGHEAEQAARCVEMYERTGEDLALYSLTLHAEGRPARAKVDRLVASYRAFAKALEGTKVRPAVLVQAILGHWARTDKEIEPWERTIDQDGRKVRFCPLDPGFGAYIDYVFTELAKCRPAFILTDDDVRAYSHGAECFCATHVKLFNARRGTSYDSDALRAAVANAKPGEPDYDVFLALQREMMEDGVVGRIRRAIDAVDPTIPGGICIAGEEHYMCAPLARRMAAKGQVPVMRAATGCYGERLAADYFPYSYRKMLSFAEHYRGSGIRLLDEADTCPQNLWSKSARSFHTHLAASCFAGMSGAKTWYVNGIRATGIPVTTAYTDVLAENRGMLDALAAACADSALTGVAIPCFTNHPNWHLVKNHGEFLSERNTALDFICVPFGVPVRASRAFGDRKTIFLLSTAAEVARLSDDDLRLMLGGRTLVFRDAALALTQRGFSDLTGVTAERKDLLFNADYDRVAKCSMIFTPAADGSVLFRAAEGAERLSDLVYYPYSGAKDFETVAPATVFYRNRLGGETVTVSYHGALMSLHRFSEARKRWFCALVDRLAGAERFAFCTNDQDVLVSERVKPDGTHLILAVNLNSEPIRELGFRVPAGVTLERLAPGGEWKPLSENGALGFYETAVLRYGDLSGETASCTVERMAPNYLMK